MILWRIYCVENVMQKGKHAILRQPSLGECNEKSSGR